MSNDPTNPLDAETIPDLLTRQMALYARLATVAAVARDADINERALRAWLDGSRMPTPDNLRETLLKLRAADAVVTHALRLWAAAKGAA